MKSLILKNLSFSLSHRTLFDDFSVSIPEKARIGIVGRNGSGKSTLLRLIKDSLGPNIGFVPQIISEFDKLSGSERFNRKLSQELGKKASILLLDEPTNHLDISNRRSLINMIERFPGMVIAVSHDLGFLNECVDTIWHIENGKINVFHGPYEDYIANLKSQKKAIQDEKDHIKSKINALHKKMQKNQEKMAKSIASGKKKVQDKRWMKVIGDMKSMQAEKSSGKKMNKFTSTLCDLASRESEIFIPKVVLPKFNILGKRCNSSLIIENGAVGYSKDNFILENINISTKESLAITGKNGSGKTTLLRAIVGDPKVYKKGKWIIPKNIGYIDQHYSILDPEMSVFATIQTTVSSINDSEIRSILNDFLFIKTEETEALVKNLSGGELARLCLAKVSLNPPDLLILDEITNNIDLETKRHIIEILRNYKWQFVIVSHDEYFLREIGIAQTYEI